MIRDSLDVFELPVSGTQLIEASAGTGKTYTISNLIVRLVAETDRAIDRILVLTFTTAATAELRERVRARLRLVAEGLRAGATPPLEDPFVVRLLERNADRAELARRLQTAIAGFDQAAIHTIHGFCQRLLAEHALSSGTPFDAALLTEESELRAEVARDFWRREVSGASKLFVEYLLANGMSTPEGLLSLVGAHLGKPYLRIRGGEAAASCEELERAYETAFAAAALVWREEGEAVGRTLLESPDLKRNVVTLKAAGRWIAQFEHIFSGAADAVRNLPDGVTKCSAAAIAAATKKDKRPPGHLFFARCETLQRRHADLEPCHARRAVNLRRRLIDYCAQELSRRKRRRAEQSYDDLLNDVARALQSRGGPALAARIREQYSAALIDEFQDTDPVQYGIFSRVYGGTDLPLYLVGDPKQAIYSFRGADVYAYLKAREEARASRHTLDVNWRSTAPLIDAVNTLYRNASSAFLTDGIEFHPVHPAGRAPRPLLVEGREETPFVLWFLARPAQEKPWTKQDAARVSAEATAAEIARLLRLAAAGRAGFREETGGLLPLRGSDIAVLVRKHSQGRQIKEALAARGVNSAEQADDSVYDSEEAEELTHVLRAVENPGDDTRVRTALVTTLLGADAERLHALCAEEQDWEAVALRFNEYHQIWREAGFFVMCRRLLEREGVPTRLLAMADGARRMTNLLHLIELLQAQAAGSRLGISQLVDWLRERRQRKLDRGEESQLRLESDEQLVQIVTVHRSKGLEFPVVFCPYLWDEPQGAPPPAAPVFFHDPAAEHAPTLQLDAGDEQARAQARLEARSESLRLCYVALTRGRHRCYVAWGAISGAAGSAPAWLMHRDRRAFPGDEAFVEWFESGDDGELRADLQALQSAAPHAIVVTTPPAADTGAAMPRRGAPTPPAARLFRGHIAAPWRTVSYTALLRQGSGDRPDHDAWASSPAAVEPIAADSIHAFPRGARAGSCLHAIFEHIDFRAGEETDWRQVVARELNRHGYALQWESVLLRMLADVLNTPLDGDRLRLARVAGGQRVNELEFHYPLHRLDARELGELFAAHTADGAHRRQIERLQFDPVRGYMKGYIDMVFELDGRWYIVDYKSNWLGPTAEDYAAERLPAVMAEEAYGLQYLIYTLALHRYLRARLPGYDYERHFGGAYYLFLRGISPQRGPGFGVYADRPAPELLAALDRYVGRGAE
ncbi:MAG: exodeoxyribonuclease V subunit beta [Gammaproteobacteria bacterium]